MIGTICQPSPLRCELLRIAFQYNPSQENHPISLRRDYHKVRRYLAPNSLPSLTSLKPSSHLH